MQVHNFLIATLLVAAYLWWNFPHLSRRAGEDEGARFVTDSGSSRLTVAQDALHVLVTGGAGFIGSHAAMLLLESGHTVTIVDNLSRGNYGAVEVLKAMSSPSKLRFVELDLGDAAALSQLMAESNPRIDLVIHFAAIAYVGESVAHPLQYYRNVTVNTINVLDAMREAQVDKLIYSSTCAVYGEGVEVPITEQTPPRPNCPYGESKLMSEQVVRAYAKSNLGFKSIILRYFNVYGSDPQGRLGEYPRPDLRQHARISGACMDAAMGILPSLTIKGTQHPTADGTCVRDYIHVDDLVRAHVAVINQATNPPPLFNVATGRGVSVREFVEACKSVSGVDIKVVEQQQARPGDYAEVWADPAKINALGWKARYVNISEGLEHAWAWRKQHPNGY